MFAFQNSQVCVVDSLIYLSGQLLKSPFQNSSTLGFHIPGAVCLAHSLNSVVEADAASGPRSKHDIEQVGVVQAPGQLSLETFSLDRSRSRTASPWTLTAPSSVCSTEDPALWILLWVLLSTPVSPACLMLSSGEKTLVTCLAHS